MIKILLRNISPMKLTWIDLNSWLFQIADQTILVDPWLVDPLAFYGLPWLFLASHTQPPCFTPATLPPIDLILLSQGVDDHCHRPTLAQLDRDIPVVASPTAAKVARTLGYTQVNEIPHGQIYATDTVKITAVPGAPIQPGQVENGYVLQTIATGATLYYEPHIFPVAAKLEQQFPKVDVAIAPVVGQKLPLLGQVIMEPQQALQLIKTLQPRIFLPTAMGEIQASGLLPKVLQTVGSVDEFRQLLSQSGLTTQFLTPAPGEMLDLQRVP